METLGTKLKAARLKKKLTASEAAKGTRIKIQHIESLERDDFTTIAAPAYAKGFIKIYAEFLGIDPEPLVQEYMANNAPPERVSLLPPEDARPSRPPKASTPISWPKLPRIPWARLKARLAAIRLPAIKRPGQEPSMRQPPRIAPPTRLGRPLPRHLAVVAAVALVVVLMLAIARCGRRPEAPSAPADRAPPSAPVTPPPPVRPEAPMPVPDRVPEPYFD
jgi:transcriptional regulator with XRE-family HTH domain